MQALKTIHLKVGWCATDRQDVTEGAVFQEDKRHNCPDCGYMNRYNDEMIEIDKKTKKVVWSSVK